MNSRFNEVQAVFRLKMLIALFTAILFLTIANTHMQLFLVFIMSKELKTLFILLGFKGLNSEEEF